MPPKTQREREQDARKAKLDQIDHQISTGSLVVRKMTDEERKRFATSREDRPVDTKPRRRRAAADAPKRPLPPAPR